MESGRGIIRLIYLKVYLNRITGCETGNYILAFLFVVFLQRDLDDAKEAGCPVYELLSNFNYKELCKFSETTRKVESDLVQLITEHGGHIKKYDSFERFESEKL